MKVSHRYVCLLSLALIVLTSFGTAQNAFNVYRERCMSCHGLDGAGKTAAGKKMETPDLRSKEFVAMSDAQMFNSIGRGTQHKNYPHSFLYTGLSEKQVHEMVGYIRQLQNK
jgi:mono/diheme cytochrome c family protein